MMTFESIFASIAEEPEVNDLMIEEIIFKSDYVYDGNEKEYGDSMFVVPRANIKRHRLSVAPSAEEHDRKFNKILKY